MKKILFAAAVVALMASCAKNEVDNDISASKKIQFSNLRDRVSSRAANDAGNDYTVFAEWSEKTTAWFIDGEVIDGTNDTYSSIYYWPNSGSVNFYAYAPANANTVTSTYPGLSIAYTVPSEATEDFTVADPKPDMTGGVVNFEFKHMLSKITVGLDYGNGITDANMYYDGYVMTATGATVTVAKNSGTLDLTAPTDWTAVSGSVSSYDLITESSIYIMPQSITGFTIQLTGVEVFDPYGNKIFVGNLPPCAITSGQIDNDEFTKGIHYRITVGICSESTDEDGNPIFKPIVFQSTPADWELYSGGSDIGLEAR